MTTFPVSFLGCKLSQLDAHEQREAVIAGALPETAGGAGDDSGPCLLGGEPGVLRRACAAAVVEEGTRAA
jgi:hypothetical protein